MTMTVTSSLLLLGVYTHTTPIPSPGTEVVRDPGATRAARAGHPLPMTT